MTAAALAPNRNTTTVSPECLYCGGHNLVPAYDGIRDRLGHVPGERAFWRCRACDSLVLVPLPRTEDLPAFYPPVYTFGLDLGGKSRLKRLLGKLEYAAFFRPQYRGQVARVLSQVATAPPPGRKLLDLGCGRGLRLIEFRARGWDVHGADLVPDVVRYVRESLGVPAECADITEVADRYPPESFDLVTAYHLFEHLPDVAGAFATCSTLLRPGGWVAVAVPLADAHAMRWFGRRWVALTEAPRHLSLPSSRGLFSAATAAGFHDLALIPDHPLFCAAVYGLSAVPGSNSTSVYGRGGLGTAVARMLGAAGVLAGLGFTAIERMTGAIPPCGILLGRKPPREGSP